MSRFSTGIKPHTPYRLLADNEFGDAKEGEIVYRFTGATYGVIATGVAMSRIDGEYPFFEVGVDNLAEVCA